MSFSFRWGIDLFDDSDTRIPNMILDNYYRVPWEIIEDGNIVKTGVGIDPREMMFIVHLARRKYESPNGKAKPSITGEIKEKMGYKTNQGVINLSDGLERKGLVSITRNPGKRSLYDFTEFSKRVLRVVLEDENSNIDSDIRDLLLKKMRAENDNPSSVVDVYSDRRDSSSVVDMDSSSGVDGTRLVESTRRSKEEGKNKKKVERDYLTDVATAKKRGVSESSAPYPIDQFFGYRDEFLKVFENRFNYYPDETRKTTIVDLAADPDADLARWERSFDEAILNWRGNAKLPPLSMVVEVYQHGGGDYETWRKWKYPDDNNGNKPTVIEKTIIHPEGGFGY